MLDEEEKRRLVFTEQPRQDSAGKQNPNATDEPFGGFKRNTLQ